MVDKKLALALREQGLPYKEIAAQLGCSESWCKKELRGVEKGAWAVDNETKVAAIAILKDALSRLESL